jgi:hypothetical protein
MKALLRTLGALSVALVASACMAGDAPKATAKPKKRGKGRVGVERVDRDEKENENEGDDAGGERFRIPTKSWEGVESRSAQRQPHGKAWQRLFVGPLPV